MRIQKVENINIALDFIKQRGVPLTNIGAEDILDGNEKLVLGLLWIIILRFTISEISEGDKTAKEGLLLWCQRKTAGYKDVNVKEFTFSWQDGLAFCALIHRHRPDLIDFSQLDRKNKAKNLKLAFDVAEEHLGISKLLDVEDLTEMAKPDERSVMTYVALYFHAFSVADKYVSAGRRLTKLSTVLETVWNMQNDYESRVTAFFEQIDNKIETWQSKSYDGTYSDAKQQNLEFQQFKITEKRSWVTEKRELDTLLSNINTKLRTYNLKPYSTPAGLALSDINEKWVKYVDNEINRKKVITKQIREVKDVLRKEFANLAEVFEKKLSSASTELGLLDGDLDTQLTNLQKIKENYDLTEKTTEELVKSDEKCKEANIEDNEYTVYTLDDLLFDSHLVKQSLQNKSAFINNQIAARSMTNITPQQLEEFESVFRHFDRDNANLLSFLQFKACVSSLGISFEDEKFELIFQNLSLNSGSVDFEQFVSYMKSLTEDKTTLDQLRESFNTVSDGEEFLTVEAMNKAHIDLKTVEFLGQQLGKFNYKFDDFLKDVFANEKNFQ